MSKSSKDPQPTAADFLPEKRTLRTLAKAAESCQGCHLFENATQTVFGEGREKAKIVAIGEQPGDREDIEGKPFVGPAGKLLAEALEQAGIERQDVYITNVVKHFKFTERGKRRVHKKPNSREIFACRPWLEAELSTVQPEAVVCLGATSAQALLGRDFRITKSRGEIFATDWCERTLATWHPAAILRMPDKTRRRSMEQELIDDLAQLIG